MSKVLASWCLPALIVGLGLYLIWRLWSFRQLREDNRTHFYAFWLWAPIWVLVHNVFAPWLTSNQLFQIVQWMMAGAILVDFFYFFIVVSSGKTRRQYFSLLAGLIVLLVLRFGWLPPRQSWLMDAPQQDNAVVWTNAVFSPERYYFMLPNSPDSRTDKNYDDPNYGKAVYSPGDGEIVEVREDGFLEMDLILEEKRLRIAIGPLVRGSANFTRGQSVLANQPLGLLDEPPMDKPFIPGLQLHVPSGTRVVFRDVRAGRLAQFPWQGTRLGRNDRAVSTAKNRFRVR